jgi:acyl-CoA dehydrogenase
LSGFIVSLFWFVLFVGGGITLAYNRVDLRTSTVATGIALLIYTIFGSGGFFWLLLLWLLFGIMVLPNLPEFRREKFTRPLLDIYRTMLRSMWETEWEELEEGKVWWDGEVFWGNSAIIRRRTGLF